VLPVSVRCYVTSPCSRLSQTLYRPLGVIGSCLERGEEFSISLYTRQLLQFSEFSQARVPVVVQQPCI
jgi:hypothetical protein